MENTKPLAIKDQLIILKAVKVSFEKYLEKNDLMNYICHTVRRVLIERLQIRVEEYELRLYMPQIRFEHVYNICEKYNITLPKPNYVWWMSGDLSDPDQFIKVRIDVINALIKELENEEA